MVNYGGQVAYVFEVGFSNFDWAHKSYHENMHDEYACIFFWCMLNGNINKEYTYSTCNRWARSYYNMCRMQ